MQRLDPDICYRALKSRDARFDGRFFVGVTSTGIYCRPVCPATTARFDRCRFFPSAAAAQEAGFRPCLRCRPETAPEHPAWKGSSTTVARGLALIAQGCLDGEDAGVDALAERLGVGARQLRRLFKHHLGATPIAVAQTRRVLFAKALLHDTRLPMTEVALASGFGSLRRFNETFQALYQRPPRALRRDGTRVLPEGSIAESGVTVKLRYRPPYDWDAMLGHLGARAVPGIERVDGGMYARTITLDGKQGSIEVAHLPRHHALAATIRFPSLGALPVIVARIRRMFDVGADAGAIAAHLGRDPMLAPLVEKRPGLRVPGCFDGFELGVRAVLGQQVTLAAARALVTRLVELCGGAHFPSPREVLEADLAGLRMPDSRRRTLRALADAALASDALFDARASIEDTVEALCAIPGIGPWTAHYIALRAARETDAFPSTDAALVRASGLSPEALVERAERWRPWRAYAAQHLWTRDSHARSTP